MIVTYFVTISHTIELITLVLIRLKRRKVSIKASAFHVLFGSEIQQDLQLNVIYIYGLKRGMFF